MHSNDGLKARIEKIKMDKVTRFFELKELWKQSSDSDRHVIDQQISELLDNMTKEETEQLTIRKRLEPVLPYLSVSNLAKNYFGKSSSWFYQRLNGNKIRGKVCRFTEEELITLETALKDISNRINTLRLV